MVGQSTSGPTTTVLYYKMLKVTKIQTGMRGHHNLEAITCEAKFNESSINNQIMLSLVEGQVKSGGPPG